MDINDRIAEYETHLRAAEREMDKALETIYDLYGSVDLDEARKAAGEAQGMVQYAIRNTYKLYDNPDIKGS